MKLGLSLGLNKQGGGKSLLSGLTGQSLQTQLFTQFSGAGEDAYEAAAGVNGRFVDIVNAATGATHLTKASNDAAMDTDKYWWNESTGAPGPIYTAAKSALETAFAAGEYTIIDWRQGTSDADQWSAASLTKTIYKGALQALFAQIKADFPSASISCGIIHRHEARDDAAWQAIREANWETIDELSYVYFGHEIYDLDLTDNVHLTEAGNEAYGARMARRHLALTGNGSAAGTLGPRITAASLETDKITLTIAHDAGTDLTVPSVPGLMRLDDDGTLRTPSAIAKTDAATITVTLADGEAPVKGSVLSLKPFYGSQDALAQTSPTVIVDNASNAMPLHSEPIVPTNDDPVQALDNIVHYWDARGSANNLATNAVIDITALAGSVTAMDDLGTAANRPDYDATAFSNAGGISVPDNSTRLHYAAAFTPGATHTFGFVLDIPSTVPDNAILGGFANSTGGVDAQGAIKFSTAGTGRIVWDLNEADGSVGYEAGWGTSGAQVLLLVEIADTGTARFYINNWTTPANITSTTDTEFNPRDDYAAWDYFLLFNLGGSNTRSPTGLKLGAFFHTTDVLTLEEREAIFDYWVERFGLML